MNVGKSTWYGTKLQVACFYNQDLKDSATV